MHLTPTFGRKAEFLHSRVSLAYNLKPAEWHLCMQ